MKLYGVHVKFILIEMEEGSGKPNICIHLNATKSFYRCCSSSARVTDVMNKVPSFHLSVSNLEPAAFQDPAAVHRCIRDMLHRASADPRTVAQSTPQIACAISQRLVNGSSMEFVICLDEIYHVLRHQDVEFATRMWAKDIKDSSATPSLSVSPAAPSAELQAIFALFRKHKAGGSVPDCAICLENLRGEKKMNCLPCSHIFHASCIRRWLEENDSCPLCRFNNIKKDEISDIQLQWE